MFLPMSEEFLNVSLVIHVRLSYRQIKKNIIYRERPCKPRAVKIIYAPIVVIKSLQQLNVIFKLELDKGFVEEFIVEPKLDRF